MVGLGNALLLVGLAILAIVPAAAAWTDADGFYDALDHAEPGGPTLSMEDMSGGTALSIPGDNSGQPPSLNIASGQVSVALPFPFEYYGTIYTSVLVNNNGYLTFSTGTATPAQMSTPQDTSGGNSNSPNHLIAGCWLDYKGSTTDGAVVSHKTIGAAPDRIFVVDFNNVSHDRTAPGTAPKASFQIKLFEGTSTIEVHIPPTPGCQKNTNSGNTVLLVTNQADQYNSVGIENMAGSDGISYFYQRAAISDAAVRFVIRNLPPVAANDTASMPEDAPVATVDVLANDSDPDGNPFTLDTFDATSVAGGTVTRDDQGTPSDQTDDRLRYTPPPQFCGTDTFTYRILDSRRAAASATVNITVTCINDAPSFVASGNVSVEEDSGTTTVTAWATGRDDGESGYGTQAVLIEISVLSGASLLSVGPTIYPDGRLVFTTAPDAWGTVSARARAVDNGTCTAPHACQGPWEAFQITIDAVHDAPDLTPGADVTVEEDAGLTTIPWGTGAHDGEAGFGPAQAISYEVEILSGAALLATTPTLSSAGLEVTPATDAMGTVALRARVVDDGDCTAPHACVGPWHSFDLTIQAINDAPSLTPPAHVSVPEDTGAVTVEDWITGRAPGGGPDEASQAVDVVVAVTGGASLLSAAPIVDAAGDLHFTTAPDAVGTVALEVHAKDDGACTAPHTCIGPVHTATITITPVNDPPSFTPGPDVTVAADGTARSLAWATGIQAGGPDESGQVLTFQAAASDAGLFDDAPTISSDGQLHFRPGTMPGSSSVEVWLEDDQGAASAKTTFTITLLYVNVAPTFTVHDVTVLEDAGAVDVLVLEDLVLGPTWEAGQTVLSATAAALDASLFADGPFIDAATGRLTFTPSDDAVGSTVVTVRVQDDGGVADGGIDTGIATLLVTLLPVNDAPTVAGPDVEVAEDAGPIAMAWGTLLAGPADEAWQPLTVTTSDDAPGLFAVRPSVDATGALTFTGAADAHGSAQVTVTVTDDNGTESLAATTTFTLTITPANDAPVAQDDTSWGFSGVGPVAIDVLANDVDADGDVLTVVSATPPGHGTVHIAGGLSYEAPAGFDGVDTFQYTVADPTGATATATVHLIVRPDPTAVDDGVSARISVVEDTPITIDVRANDHTRLRAGYATGAPDHIIATTDGAIGSTTTDGAKVTYTPAAAASGLDEFTYTLAGGSQATVYVDVLFVNDAPVGQDDAYAIYEDIGWTLFDVVANDQDEEGESIHVASASATVGQVVILPEGLRYRAPDGFEGTATLTYVPHDGHSAGAATTVTVTVADPATPVVLIDAPELVCSGVPSTWRAHGHGFGRTPTAYAWSNGQTGAVLSVAPTTPVTLTVEVTFSDGSNATADVEITPVACLRPEARFTFTLDGLTFRATDASTHATSWHWDFGDGHTSSQRHAVHTYDRGGSYVVTLIVRAASGNPDTAQALVTTVDPASVATTTAPAMPSVPATTTPSTPATPATTPATPTPAPSTPTTPAPTTPASPPGIADEPAVEPGEPGDAADNEEPQGASEHGADHRGGTSLQDGRIQGHPEPSTASFPWLPAVLSAALLMALGGCVVILRRA